MMKPETRLLKRLLPSMLTWFAFKVSQISSIVNSIHAIDLFIEMIEYPDVKQLYENVTASGNFPYFASFIDPNATLPDDGIRYYKSVKII